MNAILVWEMNPEKVTIYFLKFLNEEELGVLKLANGLMINGSETTPEQEDALMKINDALCDKAEYCSGKDHNWDQRWVGNNIDPGPFEAKIDFIFHCGFMM